MKRYVSTAAVLSVVLVASVAAFDQAATRAPLQFTCIGNEAVLVTDGTTTLISDYPYESGAFGYMKYDPASVRPAGPVTVLITHAHRDHFMPSLLDPKWSIIAPAGSEGVPAAQRTTPAALAVAGIQLTPIVTPHANIPHASYRVEWHGLALYFVGDTEDIKALTSQRGLDVAFVTPWLWRSVQEAKATIDAKQVVIYHHQTGESVAGCTGSCRIPAQGDRWQLAK